MRRILALACLALLLSGCWDRIEVEDQLFPVTIAIDKGKERRYKILLRVPLSYRLEAGVLGNQGPPTDTSKKVSAEGDTIQQAIYTFNASVARRVNIRHIRAVAIGEELAREGLDDLLAELARNADLRTAAVVYIVPGSAVEMLTLSKPTGEVNPGRINEGLILVQKQLHMSVPTRLHHLINRSAAVGVDPVTGVVGTNRRIMGKEGKGDRGIAGGLPREDENPMEIAGTAILRGRKLVGILTVDETQALLALRGEMGKAYITIPNPFGKEKPVTVRYQQENLPKYQAWFTPEGPRVSVRLLFEGEVLSGDEDYRNNETRRTMEKAAREYMVEKINSVLEKTREWQADPVGFGLLFRGRFATWADWERYGWRKQIPRLKVQVEAEVRVRRFGLTMGSATPELGD